MTKDELIRSLIKNGVLKSPALIEAFRKIDRRDFVSEEYADEAYEDYPLPIGYHQTISQPYTVAFMLELLDVSPGEKVLDVGSGSGWTTALLAYLVSCVIPAPRVIPAKAGIQKQGVGRVFGVEIVPELVKFGQKNLAKYKFPNATIQRIYPHTKGFGVEAPFDKILVSAAAEEMPHDLVRQLKVNPPRLEGRVKAGGRMVVPVKNSVWKIDRISEAEIEEEEHAGFSFVPLK